MAHDWIKMRSSLGDDPDVIGIAIACDISQDLVVGKLHRLWSWADEHTTDGHAPSVTKAFLDRYVSVAGFAQAMVDVGWLCILDEGVHFPDFERHNGKSAKKRALSAKRSSEYRAKSDAPSVTKSVRVRDLHNTTQHNSIITHTGDQIRKDVHPHRLVKSFGGWMNMTLSKELAADAMAEIMNTPTLECGTEDKAAAYLESRATLLKSMRPAHMMPKAEKWFSGEWQFDEETERSRNSGKQSQPNNRDEAMKNLEAYNRQGGSQ